MINFSDDLNNMSDDELVEIANGKFYYHDSAKSTITRDHKIREAKIILQKRAMKKPLTDTELELTILQRYVEHHDTVGLDAHKCERELDMRKVISDIIGRPVENAVVMRWYALLAPASPPHRAGVLRPCSDSTVNNASHRFHARAYFESGKAPAWERIQELESKLPTQPMNIKEKEQKFGILNSVRQATVDFNSFSSSLGEDTCLGVLFLDIDNFKSLNTKFTETIVDKKILYPFQQLLNNTCLNRGEAYRHGGEEFLLILPNHAEEEVSQFAERLRRLIEGKKYLVDKDAIQITVSIGIALWPKHGKTLEDLIAKANKAEHEAKIKGKNRVEIYFEDIV
jgi:diguanylate cyclase (GGDEF)-like protein